MHSFSHSRQGINYYTGVRISNMFFITKYRHNKIVEAYQKAIDDLREAIKRKEKFEDITERLVGIVEKINVKAYGDISGSDGWVTAGSIDVMAHLDDSIPQYVEDYHGGRVIKQEATPVTILDKKGKATYGMTKQPPHKGRTYQLIQK